MRTDPAPLVEAAELPAWAAAQRTSGKTIVFTNGCFDLMHPGHVASLQEAAQHGDVLMVATNSDTSVTALKGPGRPLLSAPRRAALLSSLRWVDAVTIFDHPSVLDTLLAVQPDVVAKGGEYRESEIVGAAEIAAWGGRVARLTMVEGFSTTQFLEHIRSAPGAEPFHGKDAG